LLFIDSRTFEIDHCCLAKPAENTPLQEALIETESRQLFSLPHLLPEIKMA
jgi:hypothetical protein